MQSLSDYIYGLTLASEQKVTEEVIDYYEKNPSELDLLLEEDKFQLGFLFAFFIIGLVVMIATRSAQLFLQDQLPEFVTGILLEVFLEIGKALLGGTIVAYFIEFLRHKEFTHNKAFRAEIKQRIEARAKTRGK